MPKSPPVSTPMHPGSPPVYDGVVPRFPGVDGRTRAARRYRDLLADLTSALGREPSPADRLLLADAAALALESESLAAQAAAGARIDPDLRVRVSGALARALERLGLVPAAREPAAPDPLAPWRKMMGHDQ